jgi:hypothetical protein
MNTPHRISTLNPRHNTLRSRLLPAALVAAAAAATGCANIEQTARDMGIVVTKVPVAAGTSAPPAGAATPATPVRAQPVAAVNPLQGTELDGIFKKNPISNSRSPERWPRVAITVKSATPGVFSMNQQQLGPNDCVTFDVRLWTNEKTSKRFENLQICTPTLQNVLRDKPIRTMDLLPRFTVPWQDTTASRRTEGPVPPFYLFPQDIGSTQGWVLTHMNTKFYLAGIFVLLGWDWDDDFDRRVWVVSVPPARYQ